MLSYEYAVNMLSTSDWVKEKRKQIKEMQRSHRKLNYIDISIPILAGAFAGKHLECTWYLNDFRRGSTRSRFKVYFCLLFAGFMSWCLVIPFDTMKTIVQAEIDPLKHGDMTQVFKAKRQVNISEFRFSSEINFELNQNDYVCFL